MKLILICFTLIGLTVCEQSALQEFTAGNIEFSARLYKELLKDHKDSFIASPLSAQIVLALTQAGAEGPTAEEFSTGLNLPVSKKAVQEAMQSYLPGLQRSDDKVKILSANKVYVKNDFKIKDTFKQIAVNTFKSEVENIDFNQGAKAAATINKWVEDKTNEKIKNLISSDAIDGDTRLILVNAIYFSAPWQNTFEKYFTKKQPFYISETNKVDVDMMATTDTFKYYECKKHNVKYLEMDYEGSSGVSMTIVLPNEKTGLLKMEENVHEFFQPLNYTHQRVEVNIPKFEVETDIPMKDVLQRLGLKKVFSAKEADLSGISETPLVVDDVVQKAFIKVNEDGTEAAAATYVGVALLSAPFLPKRPFYIFTADHPFLYIIRDTNSGLILFTGRYSR